MSKLQKLIEEYGYDDGIAMLEEYGDISIVPAICMNKDCDAMYEYEPDQDKGWCSECNTGSVKSLLILMGII
tara:strand:- start:546 stop:761 length:216 start_codon:yes stop_codon:yes gene_type:complete